MDLNKTVALARDEAAETHPIYKGRRSKFSGASHTDPSVALSQWIISQVNQHVSRIQLEIQIIITGFQVRSNRYDGFRRVGIQAFYGLLMVEIFHEIINGVVGRYQLWDNRIIQTSKNKDSYQQYALVVTLLAYKIIGAIIQLSLNSDGMRMFIFESPDQLAVKTTKSRIIFSAVMSTILFFANLFLDAHYRQQFEEKWRPFFVVGVYDDDPSNQSISDQVRHNLMMSKIANSVYWISQNFTLSTIIFGLSTLVSIFVYQLTVIDEARNINHEIEPLVDQLLVGIGLQIWSHAIQLTCDIPKVIDLFQNYIMRAEIDRLTARLGSESRAGNLAGFIHKLKQIRTFNAFVAAFRYGKGSQIPVLSVISAQKLSLTCQNNHVRNGIDYQVMDLMALCHLGGITADHANPTFRNKTMRTLINGQSVQAPCPRTGELTTYTYHPIEGLTVRVILAREIIRTLQDLHELKCSKLGPS